jgi:hypothetical protein
VHSGTKTAHSEEDETSDEVTDNESGDDLESGEESDEDKSLSPIERARQRANVISACVKIK